MMLSLWTVVQGHLVGQQANCRLASAQLWALTGPLVSYLPEEGSPLSSRLPSPLSLL